MWEEIKGDILFCYQDKRRMKRELIRLALFCGCMLCLVVLLMVR